MSIIHAIRTAVTIGMIVTLAIHPAFIVPSGYVDGLASKVDAASLHVWHVGAVSPNPLNLSAVAVRRKRSPLLKPVRAMLIRMSG